MKITLDLPADVAVLLESDANVRHALCQLVSAAARSGPTMYGDAPSLGYRQEQLLRLLEPMSPEGLTVQDLHRLAGVPSKSVARSLSALLDRGLVLRHRIERAPATGRPAYRYTITGRGRWALEAEQ